MIKRIGLFVIALLLSWPVIADNVLVVHQNYNGSGQNIGARLVAEGHTVTYTTSDPTSLAGYQQVWDVRYSVAITGSLAALYDNFIKNSGYIYLTAENPGCCAVRNNSVATFISNAGGGATTIGGTAGQTSNTLNVVNAAYMTAGITITFAAGSAIVNSQGTWLFKDSAGKVGGMMWVGNAGNLGQGYNGTILVVSDINWTDNTFFNANNLTAVDDIINGVVAGTVGGTITASGNGSAATSGNTGSSLCCGASDTTFNADANNVAKVATFVSRTSADSKVHIDQIGNFNTITVEQSGTRNNYMKYAGNGDSNTVTTTQSGTASTQTNYIDLGITGNSNTVTLTQTSTGGGKGIFATVANHTNVLAVQQKDSGSHYAEINLSGGSKTVDLLQQGSAAHMAKITLSGQPVGLNLSQSGATQQFYSINYNCATAGGCAAISVTQGQ